MSADDDSKNPESEASTGQPDPYRLLESRLDSIVEYVERLENRYDADLGELQAEVERCADLIQQERDARQQELASIRERLSTVEQRTDMQRLVERADNATAEQRQMALLQHIERKARRREPSKASLDKEGVLEALHHPDVHRTQPYVDMQEVADRFPDAICRYDDGVLYLDLSDVQGSLSQHAESVIASQQSDGVPAAQTAKTDGGSPTNG